MSKAKRSIRSEIRNAIKKYESDILCINEDNIVCNVCKIEIKTRTTQAIGKNCNSTSHRKCVEMKSEEPSSSSFSCAGLTTRVT